MLDVGQVYAATHAAGATLKNIQRCWPELYHALHEWGAASQLSQIGAVATIAIECPPFRPIAEYGEHPEYDTGRKAKLLGNTPEADGDGQRYEGRGFIQLTGRANYRYYGQLLGIPLEEKPELALHPTHAANIFAAYWFKRQIHRAAEMRDWRAVRKLVNGGLTHFDRFAAIIEKLGEPVERAA